MGKKSLLKSTAKKKAAPKKTITKKTATKKKAGVKKNTAKKATQKKKAAPKKKASPKKAAVKKQNEVGTIKEPPVKEPSDKKTAELKPVADIKEEKSPPDIEEITPEEIPQATIMEEETPEDLIHNEEKTKDTTIEKPETDKEYKSEITMPAVANTIEEIKPAPASTIHKPLQKNSKISLPPDKTNHENADTGKMPIIFGTALLVIIMILITGISISNSKKYYLEYRNGAIKIFKGTFEPVGKSMLITLHGVEAPESTKAVYSKEEIYPIITNYYIDKAATLLEVPGMPDFKGIKTYLEKAIKFATSEELLKEVERRIKSLDFMVLLYKADLMADTGSLSGLQDASRYLKEAASINTDKAEAEIVEKKLQAVQKLIDDIKKKTAKNPEISPGDAKDKSK